tara:strand:+ start:462 stop:1472 length:1011 start_codon:yes stop_codon:yes gene_type:complete
MGGRALKTAFTRRYSKQEFDTVSKELIDIIEKTYTKACTPLFYNKKETFGDIDIIVSVITTDMGAIRHFVENTFKPTEIFSNGNAISFDYKEVQVDLICVPEKDFGSNYHYLAFNDLGNFIGRLAQSMGLKYGQEGLWYNHFSDANTKDKIIVSKNYRDIFNFLDLDYDKWTEGFDTLEDIFEYIMTSHLFNPKMFQLKELNKINRERNLKRASYMSFLEYIGDKGANPEYDGEVIYALKKDVINVIREAFPEANIDLRLAEIDFNAAKKKLVNIKFNGKFIMDEYGLNGKELGDAITKFKTHVNDNFPEKTFEDFIIKHRQEAIFNLFKGINNIK